MSLIDPSYGKPVPGLRIPNDLYWAITAPAPLAGMRCPQGSWPWTEIAKAGLTRVVSLHPGTYDPTPLFRLCTIELEDLAHGRPPQDQDAEIGKIREAVSMIVGTLHSKQGVVVHCDGGRGRTGTVLGCVLREMSYAADDVIDWLDRVHKARGKPGWPESAWQSKLVRCWPTQQGQVT